MLSHGPMDARTPYSFLDPGSSSPPSLSLFLCLSLSEVSHKSLPFTSSRFHVTYSTRDLFPCTVAGRSMERGRPTDPIGDRLVISAPPWPRSRWKSRSKTPGERPLSPATGLRHATNCEVKFFVGDRSRGRSVALVLNHRWFRVI